MTSYFKLMLGQGSEHIEKCVSEEFIGVHYRMDMDLTGTLTDDWQEFNRMYIPEYLKVNAGKSTRAAGLACATIWMVAKGMKVGDVIISPDSKGAYITGEIIGGYQYHHGEILPHRRKVRWYPKRFLRAEMSEALKNSMGSIGTYMTIREEFIPEVTRLISGHSTEEMICAGETAAEFALESHLGDFLIKNWEQTELGVNYDLYEDENEDGCKVRGREIQTDTGRIDILAISKDKREFLVIELKNNRASDQAVGQVQRYMGYVKSELANNGEQVKGLIIAMENDLRIKRALSVAVNIEFWRYEVNFKLAKES